MAFLVGFLVPLPQYFLKKFFPASKISKTLCMINAPILCWYLGCLCVGIKGPFGCAQTLAFIVSFQRQLLKLAFSRLAKNKS
jgi:hypothetical protein